LSGAGVAYLLAQVLYARRSADTRATRRFLDLVALATIADYVPLLGWSRALVYEGLHELAVTPREGLRKLAAGRGVSLVTASAADVGWRLAPPLKAGRSEMPLAVRDLLSLRPSDDAATIVDRLIELHRARRVEADAALPAAVEQVEASLQQGNLGIVRLSLGHGIATLVAGRLVERFHRPIVLVNEQDAEILRGTVRGIPGWDVAAALATCRDFCIGTPGGHAGAGGFSVAPNNLDVVLAQLRASTEMLTPEQLVSTLRIDALIDPDELSPELLGIVRALEPTGQANPAPVFGILGVAAEGFRRFGKDQEHLQFSIGAGCVRCVAWSASLALERRLREGLADLAAQVEEYPSGCLSLRLVDVRGEAQLTVEGDEVMSEAIPPGEIIVITYDGQPPTDEQIQRELGLTPGGADDDYTYIVPTAALERQRENLAPRHQWATTSDGVQPQLVFHKVMRHFLNERLLTRAEERVALLRAIQTVEPDPVRARQVARDVFAWRDALASLAATDLNLADGVPDELQEDLVSPAVGELLRALQGEYRARQRDAQRRSFEDALGEFLRHGYQPTPRVVLEGFTYFTDLQKLFIQTCLARGAMVLFIHPYRAEQTCGFEILQQTFTDFPHRQVKHISTTWSSPPSDLARLQRALFGAPLSASGDQAADIPDGTVTVRAFRHRHREIAAVVAAIRQHLEKGGKTRELAIVVRDPGSFQALLREEADLQHLGATLGIPPRLLLLTPLGRFILTLYHVWSAQGGLKMTADDFQTILSSGWLGALAQATTDLFAAVQAQVFARCETETEWRENLDRLRRISADLSASSRLPAASVDVKTIRHWEAALDAVIALCTRLFSGNERSIGEHVRHLLDELTALVPEDLLQTEREVLERIRTVLLELADSTSLAMTADEFGVVLNSLVQERERPPEEEDGPEDAEDQESPEQRRIWIATPEAIDGYQRDIVYYIGVDDQRVPRPYTEPWPFVTPNIPESLARERYLFLAVCRAARRQLHLSYARADERGTYGPSPYLDAVAATLDVSISEEEVIAPAEALPAEPSPSPLRRARRKRYSLAELAHFGLCPFRAKLERLDPQARRYEDPFHVQFLAQAAWLDLVFTGLEGSTISQPDADTLADLFRAAMQATRSKVAELFPGLRPLDWQEVERRVDEALDFFASPSGGMVGPYPVTFERPPVDASYTVTDGDRAVQIDATPRHAYKRGIFHFPITQDLLREEWLIPGARPTDRPQASSPRFPPAYTEVEGVRVFASQYDAVQWWRRAVMDAFCFRAASLANWQPAGWVKENYAASLQEVGEWVALMEAGRYPKHPGENCYYCPVRSDCLGR
jgi:hypothetical protein